MRSPKPSPLLIELFHREELPQKLVRNAKWDSFYASRNPLRGLV